MVDAAASRSGLGASSGQAGSESDAKAADDYVRLTTEVEESFYVTHYTDAQLASVATYLESKPGQAVLTRVPKVRGALAAVLAQELPGAVSSLPERVCTTVACSPDQQSRLAAFASAMAAGVPSFINPPS